MSKVAISKCDNYNLDTLKEKINQSLDLIGGIDAFIKKDDKVFIKLNCVGPFNPSMGITTHPMFVKAIIQIVKSKTNNITVGDNPATKDIIYTLKKCGIYDVILAEKVNIIDGKKLIEITNSKPKIFNTFQVSKDMVDVDVLINLPKLKTHALTYMTVAQKNLFGFIYGLSKAGWHVKASNPLQFGDAINDLYGAILEAYENKKLLHICDGIIGLEGEGPSTGGFPIQSNVILSSTDAVSLDRVAVEVVNLNYEKLFINKIANERGYGEGDINKIEVVGEKLKEFKDLKFIPSTNEMSIFSLRLLKIKGIRNLVLEHPIIDQSLCIKCGECAKICPPKTMTIKPNQFPILNKTNCIRCWCCAEVCPKNAIKKSRRPFIGKLVFKGRN